MSPALCYLVGAGALLAGWLWVRDQLPPPPPDWVAWDLTSLAVGAAAGGLVALAVML